MASCQSFEKLALILRQRGLQIIEANTIHRDQYQAELRLQKMRSLVSHESTQAIKPKTSRIRSLINSVIALFGRFKVP